MEKHFSLSQTFINYDCKKVHNIQGHTSDQSYVFTQMIPILSERNQNNNLFLLPILWQMVEIDKTFGDKF